MKGNHSDLVTWWWHQNWTNLQQLVLVFGFGDSTTDLLVFERIQFLMYDWTDIDAG
jgi:hypothetical protein